MNPKSYPLRTALIGLSSSAATSWAASAHLPSLLSDAGRTRYAIKGLLNSSIDASKLAIETYRLPSDIKTYGSPEELAADPDIDIVICNTRVDRHYDTILPSVRAGKDVFVEWPIAAKTNHIEELVGTAKQSGSRIAVGLQRRWNPIVVRLRELVGGGRGAGLGKLLNVEARMFGASNDREVLPTGLKYFTQKEVGGNAISIGVGHAVLDMLLSAIGDVEYSTVQAKTQIQRPNVRIRDASTSEIVEKLVSDVPDLLSFNARLQPTPHTAEDATLTFFFRRGQPFPDTSPLTCSINFEYGEVKVDSPLSGFLDAGDNDEPPTTISLHRFDNDRVEVVEWNWSTEQSELPLMARAVSTLLYAFADRRPAGDGWVSIEDAAMRAALIDRLLNA